MSFFSGGENSPIAPIVADGYDCSINEAQLSNCTIYEYGTLDRNNCDNVAGVMCEGK